MIADQTLTIQPIKCATIPDFPIIGFTLDSDALVVATQVAFSREKQAAQAKIDDVKARIPNVFTLPPAGWQWTLELDAPNRKYKLIGVNSLIKVSGVEVKV